MRCRDKDFINEVVSAQVSLLASFSISHVSVLSKNLARLFGSKAVIDTYVVEVLHLHLNLEREVVSVRLE